MEELWIAKDAHRLPQAVLVRYACAQVSELSGLDTLHVLMQLAGVQLSRIFDT